MIKKLSMLFLQMFCMLLITSGHKVFGLPPQMECTPEQTVSSIKAFLETNGYIMDTKTIGSGSFGKVFLATDVHEKTVAIKCVANEKSSKYEFEIFQNQAIKSCENITQTIAKFVLPMPTQNICILIMERNLGKTLADIWLDAEKKIDEKAMLIVLTHISNTLVTLQKAGYVHRDIKPDNIMFHDGKFRLIDFGFIIPIKEKNKPVSGYHPYIAPEILKYAMGQQPDYDEKIDIWSLGVMAYHLLSGHFPYEARNNDENPPLPLPYEQIIANQKHFCKEIVPSIDYFNGILKKCLTFDPQLRISAKKLFEELSALSKESSS